MYILFNKLTKCITMKYEPMNKNLKPNITELYYYYFYFLSKSMPRKNVL